MLDTIADVFKEAYRRGWITTRDGNASYRRPEQGFFYVTPSAVRKNLLTAEMMIKLDISAEGTSRARWLEAADETSSYKRLLNANLSPTGELPMHWRLQRFLPDQHGRFVLHLHPTYTTAVTTAFVKHNDALCYGAENDVSGRSLIRLAKEFPEIFRYTRVGKMIPYIQPISEALGEAVAGALLAAPDSGELKADVVGLAAHGAVAVGRDAWEAFEHIERLEHVCQIYAISEGLRLT